MITEQYRFEEASCCITPQLLFYKDIITENIRKMIEMAGGPDRLWPHVKSHKTAELVKLQMGMGISRFKCATIAEAEMAAQCGASYVLIAYPMVGPNVGRFLALMKAYPDTQFWTIADCTQQVEALSRQTTALKPDTDSCNVRISLLMDLDMGLHRTGTAFSEAASLYQNWSRYPGILLRGFHCYDGNRHEQDPQERMAQAERADRQILAMQRTLQESGCLCDTLVMGGTPSFPCHIRCTDGYLSPGTVLLQDAGYLASFPDLDFTPGALLLTRVISHPSPDTFTCDLGTKAVACDPPEERAVIVGMEYASTMLRNEEHWVLKVPPEHIADIPPIGAELYAIPAHICPTTALYPSALVISGGKLAGEWEVTARNRKINI